MTGNVEFAVRGGNACGYLALPPEGTGPGLILFHAWWGLNTFFQDLADRLAAEGFVVLAPDFYQGSLATTVEEAERLSTALDRARSRRVATAAAEFLRRDSPATGPAIGVAGISMGAPWALWLAERLSAEVAAAVVLYGTARGEFLRTRAAFLGHFAERDPFEPLASVRRLEKRLMAGRSVTFHVYPGTGHWFFESDRLDAYDAGAAQLVWERTVAFLKQHLAGPA